MMYIHLEDTCDLRYYAVDIESSYFYKVESEFKSNDYYHYLAVL